MYLLRLLNPKSYDGGVSRRKGHGERTTTEVASQNRKRRHSRMPLQIERPIGEAHSGRVREDDRAEEGGGERRHWKYGGVVDMPLEK